MTFNFPKPTSTAVSRSVARGLKFFSTHVEYSISRMRETASLLIVFYVMVSLLLTPVEIKAATQVDIVGPAGSELFGSQVVALPNGNIVVTDPLYDSPTAFRMSVQCIYITAQPEHSSVRLQEARKMIRSASESYSFWPMATFWCGVPTGTTAQRSMQEP